MVTNVAQLISYSGLPLVTIFFGVHIFMLFGQNIHLLTCCLVVPIWSIVGRYIHSSFPKKSIGIASGMVDSGRSIMDRVSPPRPHNYLLSLFISCVVIVTNSFVV